DEQKDKIRGSSVLVLNALRKETHISHFNLQEAVDLVKELGVPKAYFTHISHQLGLHQDINNELPEGMELAFDGLTLTVENTLI
ncbi:MAG: MBL fold metallo-hydrolase, partial [Chitinophagaceae bacterium]